MPDAPIIKISPVTVQENVSIDGENRWKATTLFVYAKDLQPFDVPLAGLPVGTACWRHGSRSAIRLAEEATRMMNADLAYPIILDEMGFVLDGWHRVAKALYLGHSTIKAVRLEKNPPPDWTEKEEETT